MIYINRNRRDKNGKPIRPSKKWFKKARAATERAIEERDAHEWDTGIYASRKEVRAALEKLFFGKCAYCEQPLPEIWDVEHYRPKSRVAERKNDHPGYYWLGYTWDNMYPSCTNCNRRLKDKPLWDDLRELPAGGKFDQFPLSDEFTRIMSHDDGDISNEATLLIDPCSCSDDPESYFKYDPKGQISALGDNPRGTESIRVYNLARRRLRERRRKIFRRTATVLKIIEGLQRDGADNKGVLKMSKELLLEMISDGGEHTGVARFVKKNKLVFCK